MKNLQVVQLAPHFESQCRNESNSECSLVPTYALRKSRADKCNSFSSAKICYSNMNSYRVFAPVFFREYLIKEKKSENV